MSIVVRSAPIRAQDCSSWPDQPPYPPPHEAAPRTLIISNIRLYRDALQQNLLLNRCIEVVGTATVETAADETRRLDPDIAVLDANAPHALSLARVLKAMTLRLGIVVVTAASGEADFLAWAEAGIGGYVDQDSSADDLAAAIHHAARGEVLCSPRFAGLLAGQVAKLSAERLKATNLDTLTPRERQILALVAEGLSNKAIAQQLGISDTTTKNHVHNILDKLGAQSRGQAAAQYRRIQPAPQPRLCANAC